MSAGLCCLRQSSHQTRVSGQDCQCRRLERWGADTTSTLLIIAGNDLRGDDGAARAALSVLRPNLSDHVSLWDSASCLEAVPDILSADAVVIADTVLAGGRPGDVHCLTIGPDDPLPLPGSLHDCGPLAALAIARQFGWAREATLVGIEPATLDGETLSAPVKSAIPRFAAVLLDAIRGCPHVAWLPGIGSSERPLPKGCGHAHHGPATASPDSSADGSDTADSCAADTAGAEHG